MSAADLHNVVQQGPLSQHGPAQVGPILPTATGDHVIDGGRGKALMIEVAMKHKSFIFSSS